MVNESNSNLAAVEEQAYHELHIKIANLSVELKDA
jgi:hypothetical protein